MCAKKIRWPGGVAKNYCFAIPTHLGFNPRNKVRTAYLSMIINISSLATFMKFDK